MRFSAALLTALFATSAGAQSPAVIRRVAFPLLDIVVLWDTTPGIRLLAAPNMQSEQGAHSPVVHAIAFSFDSLRAWLPTARVFIDSAQAYVNPTSRRAIGTKVSSVAGGALVLGFDPAVKDDEPYFLTIYGDDTGRWTIPASATGLHVLLDGLTWVLLHSTSVNVMRYPGVDSLIRLGGDLKSPRVKRFPFVMFPPGAQVAKGRVWGQFMVTTEGRVDPASIQILLSDDPAFDEAARSAWSAERFDPARIGEHPISMLVFQSVVFRH